MLFILVNFLLIFKNVPAWNKYWLRGLVISWVNTDGIKATLERF
jgi:hypothetical protein